MFFTPRVRVFNSENADNSVQRKQGNPTISRKPFLDKAVNYNATPDITSKQKQLSKPVSFSNKQVLLGTPPSSPTSCSTTKQTLDSLDCAEFEYTPKDANETFEDILPIISEEKLLHIMQKCCSGTLTPPPSPSHEGKFWDHPDMEFPFEIPDIPASYFTSNYNRNVALFNSEDEVPLPTLDIEDESSLEYNDISL